MRDRDTCCDACLKEETLRRLCETCFNKVRGEQVENVLDELLRLGVLSEGERERIYNDYKNKGVE